MRFFVMCKLYMWLINLPHYDINVFIKKQGIYCCNQSNIKKNHSLIKRYNVSSTQRENQLKEITRPHKTRQNFITMLSHAALLHKSVFESIRIFAGARRVLVSGFSVWRRRRPRNCRRSILHTTAETLYARHNMVYIHAERINSGSKWDVAPGQRRWKDEKFRPQQQRCMWACKSMRVGCCGEGNDLLVASQLQDKEIVGCACNHCHCARRDSLSYIYLTRFCVSH
jgi:hypothetical protein